MRFRPSRRQILLGLGLPVLLITGGVAVALHRFSDHICTLKRPASSQVAVIVREVDAGALARARACLGIRCRPLRQLRRRVPPIWLTGFAVPRRAAMRSLVLILERPGQPAQVISRRVQLQRTEENGSGCGTEWIGVARYADGKLVQIPFDDVSQYVRN